MSMLKRGIMFFLVFSGVVAAHLNATVQLDATYAIAQARGPVCGGVGDVSTGSACPLKGDIAVANCNSTLPTYNGTDCVAPANAECIIDEDSKWRCIFPDNDDLSSTLDILSDNSADNSPWGDLPWRAPPPLDSVVSEAAAKHLKTSEDAQIM